MRPKTGSNTDKAARRVQRRVEDRQISCIAFSTPGVCILFRRLTEEGCDDNAATVSDHRPGTVNEEGASTRGPPCRTGPSSRPKRVSRPFCGEGRVQPIPREPAHRSPNHSRGSRRCSRLRCRLARHCRRPSRSSRRRLLSRRRPSRRRLLSRRRPNCYWSCHCRPGCPSRWRLLSRRPRRRPQALPVDCPMHCPMHCPQLPRCSTYPRQHLNPKRPHPSVGWTSNSASSYCT